MRLFFSLLTLCLSNATGIYSQSCWDSIKVANYPLTCGGSDDGYISLVYRTSKNSPNDVYIEVSKEADGSIVASQGGTKDFGFYLFRNLKPGIYKVLVYQIYNKTYVCHSVSFPEIKSPGCDLSIGTMKLNVDPASPNFVEVTGKISGHFCTWGYENSWGKVINGVESPIASFPTGSYYDSLVKADMRNYVLPGDTVQFYIDNSNKNPGYPPSYACRVYSETQVIGCDIGIDSFSVYSACDDIYIQGKLKTSYLKLLQNDNLKGYASSFFKFGIYDLSGNLISDFSVTDTSGTFSFVANGTFFPQTDYILKWNLGHCSFKQNFSIQPLSPTTSLWTGRMDHNWDNRYNWSCNKVPAETTDVLIQNGSVILDSDMKCKRITVKPHASFRLNPNKTLIITNK